MANCMTCRHNDKKAKYCTVKKAHTDLGYVLNCIAWAPTDEAEMKRLRTENAKLRELCKDMMAFVEDDDACERCGHDAECVEAADGELVLPYEGQCLMLGLFVDRMRELGLEVPDGD